MPGRDLSQELYGSAAADQANTIPATTGRNLSAELYGQNAAPAASTLDRVKAAVAGVNKGFYSDLLGLPVDTVANVLDLGKAAFGYGASKLTGKPPPDWTAPSDRSHVAGSSEWLAQKINDIGLGGAINNPAPQDMTSRIVYSGGRVAGQSIVPNPRATVSLAQNAGNMAKGAISGGLAGAVGEVAPDWAGVAGMAPQLASAAGAAGVKRVVRGNEAGRAAMAQRLQDLQNGGIASPSVGLASGNALVQGIENLASQTPGSMGMYDSARAQNLAGMKARVDQLRDSASPVFGPVEAGSAIQSDLTGLFRDRIGSTYDRLNDRVEQAVGPDTPVPVSESIARSAQLTTPVPGAESTSTNFINQRIAKINADLVRDSGGAPAQVFNSPIILPNGQPAGQTVIPATPPQGVPFSALKDLRTKIGKEAASNAIMGTPEQGDFKQLYGAMSQDMRNGVTLADAQNGIDPAAGGSATTALNRANTFYSRAMTRADELGSLANRSTPEGAYGAVARSLSDGPTVYERLRGVISPAARQKVVATVIDELGNASPGQQGAAGDAWSPRTFLTNYNKLDGGSREALFQRIPGGAKMAGDLADIAKAAEMLGDSAKVWSNPSGTSHAAAARGAVGALTFGAFVRPLYAAGTAGGLLAANQVSQRLLLNPKFVNWLARAPQVRPEQAQAYAQRLVANARLTKDPQFQQDVGTYLSAVGSAGDAQQSDDNEQ